MVFLSNSLNAKVKTLSPFCESSKFAFSITFLSLGVNLRILPQSIMLSTLSKITSKAPFVNMYFLPLYSLAILISFRSESNASSAILGYCFRYSSSSIPCFSPSTVSAISVGSPIPSPLLCVLSLTSTIS